MNTIDWIFFDIGGVLADESKYQEYRRSTALEIVGRFVKGITLEEYDRAYQDAGHGAGSLTERVIQKLLDNAGVAQYCEAALEILNTEFRSGPTYLEMEEVNHDAREVIEKLAKRYRIGIIANQPEGIKEKLEAAGVLSYLSDCTVANDAEGKPNLEYYRKVLNKNEATPARSIMIDDNLSRGIVPAKALGMTTIWFGQTERSEFADYTVQSLNDLLPLLLPQGD